MVFAKYWQGLVLLIAVSAGTVFGQSAADTNYVVLKSGEKVYGKVEYKTSFFKGANIVLNDSIRYSVASIRAFKTVDGYFALIKGVFGSYDLAKRVEEGRVDLYVKYNESSLFRPGISFSTPGGMISTPGHFINTSSKTEYFSKDNGAIQKASYDNVRLALQDNPESMNYLNQHRNLTIAQIGAAVAGVGIVIASLATFEKGADKGPPAGIFVGIGVSSLAWIPHLMKADKIEQAIRSYNRQ